MHAEAAAVASGTPFVHGLPISPSRRGDARRLAYYERFRSDYCGGHRYRQKGG
jgi:hypothetical protein